MNQPTNPNNIHGKQGEYDTHHGAPHNDAYGLHSGVGGTTGTTGTTGYTGTTGTTGLATNNQAVGSHGHHDHHHKKDKSRSRSSSLSSEGKKKKHANKDDKSMMEKIKEKLPGGHKN